MSTSRLNKLQKLSHSKTKPFLSNEGFYATLHVGQLSHVLSLRCVGEHKPWMLLYDKDLIDCLAGGLSVQTNPISFN